MQLPATRALAADLGISRTLIVQVYDELFAEGFVRGRHGSGTYIEQDLPLTLPSSETSQNTTHPDRHMAVAEERGAGRSKSTIIDFRVGVTTLPSALRAAWKRMWRQVGQDVSFANYGAATNYPALQETIAAYLNRARNLICSGDDLLILPGTTQAIQLIADTLITDESIVGCEEPGYPPAHMLFRHSGAQLISLPVDEDGLQVEFLPTLRHPPHVMYVTPAHQYPLGGRLTFARRKALLDWASHQNCLIIEDDYDSELRFDGPPLPPLASMDTEGRVIYLGTFSKVLSPAIRTSYLLAPSHVRRRIHALQQRLDSTASWPTQVALASFMQSGEFERHIRRMRRYYRLLRATLCTTLDPLRSIARIGGLDAGLHAVLELPHTYDDLQISALARDRMTVVTPLRSFSLGAPQRQGLVLGFGGLSQEEVVAGCQRLVDLISEYMPIP
jgi:GntR family transcriptional regulator/MocR family aminotransferase